ncbi:hypothetical protein [Moorena sp. SIO3B2]|uniref:hypothetical protein n=1 Tax=Moorena sp. SIO3B2 TaxID=2607827 RepID=UPI0013C8C4EA|nr:hypothetical protein [Moorena sp. SIO3B2]NEP32920.1 hypothetical protein [Moorena sp. SIO3B2]
MSIPSPEGFHLTELHSAYKQISHLSPIATTDPSANTSTLRHDNGSVILARAVENYQAGNILEMRSPLAWPTANRTRGAAVVPLSMVPKAKLTNGTMNGYPLNVSLIRFNKRLEQGRWVDVLNYAPQQQCPNKRLLACRSEKESSMSSAATSVH